MNIKDKIKDIWESFFRKWLPNKYVITCLLFAFVFAFCGEQSIVSRVRYANEIRALKREKNKYKNQTEQYRKDIYLLENNTDSLERFAREHYYMHAKGETVFLIEE